nr:MAG TPA: hypothetical protein [Caudoviricetes sp.]
MFPYYYIVRVKSTKRHPPSISRCLLTHITLRRSTWQANHWASRIRTVICYLEFSMLFYQFNYQPM